MMNAKRFFKEQQERMNFSDDDTDDIYVARMTGEDFCIGSNEENAAAMKNFTQDAHYASSPRGFKRKTDRSTLVRSSPRIKRSKSSTLSANQVEEEGAALNQNEHSHSSNNASLSSVLDKVASNGSYSGSSNVTFDKALDSVPRLKVAATMIFDEDKAAGISSDASTAPSSPIADASTFYIPADSSDKSPEREKSMLEIILEAKHSTRRRGAKKTIPLTRLQIEPKAQAHPADETSIIDNYSSSEPPTSSPHTSPDRLNSFLLPDVSLSSKPSNTSAEPKSRVTSTSSLVTAKSSETEPKGTVQPSVPPKKPTPYEFACQVQNAPVNKTGVVQFLEGLRIYYCGLDVNSKLSGRSTQRRLKIILRHGGSIIPKYEPDRITHIVVDPVLHPISFLKATGLEKLNEVPEHIPILAWQWVVALIDNNPFPRNGKVTKIRQVSSLFEYGAYSSRLPPISAVSTVPRAHKQKRASNQDDDQGDSSRISEFSVTNIKSDVLANDDSSRHKILEPQQSRRTVVRSASTRVPLDFQPVKNESVDPLVEFYLQETGKQPHRQNEIDSETDGSDLESHHQKAAPKSKRDWLCKQPNQNAKPCPNEDIIRKLEELQELHKVKPTEDDHWRVYSYSKSIRALRAHPKRIKSLEDAQKIPGIGKKTAQKIMEIIETGDLQRIAYERTEDVKVLSIFTKIYGVGIQTATMWYARGCRTIEDLCNGVGDVTLNEGQKIGIKFYDDLNSRMPREEAKAIFELIKPIALRIDPELFVEIMGSYRRGKADCGDIDILITRCPDDGRTHEGVLHELLQKLHIAGILTEDLALPDYSKPLEAVYHGLCRLPNVPGTRRRRIDFLTVPWSSKGGALLYYTGDDMFNRSMRLLANKMGYSLNQRGLYAGVVRDPRNRTVKLNTGNLIASETEVEIFEALGVPWREPHERVTYYQDIAKAEVEKKTTNAL
ncbi:DNA polymerase lambda [Lentinula boryana]|uniref:DNA polymerase beta n=1 Tax=Lentinula boryana TaxID=40481 RepID=A0ABQ8QGN0_9AGAR|nr:DNA polymerase lambda [Lentinula boryana]